ncbi:alpha-amylase family glycosyl hydrolase [Winogradskyella sp. A3E31]|uniref:alpha-amylase family glycosyl hydrolase n=1 Tax=Winogradskyella sp. A3E31 TaxID=3349637 RepID=UPI00398ADE85
MKKKLLLFGLSFCLMCSVYAQTFTWTPEFFNDDEANVTLTVSNFDPVTEWGVSDIYLWAWHFNSSGTQINNPSATGSDFGNSPETAKFTDNMDGTYSYNFGVPETFFASTDVAEIGFLIKSQDGSNQSGDNFKQVGKASVNLSSPSSNLVVINSGDNVSISGTISFQGSTTVQGTIEVFLNDDVTPTVTSMCGFPNCNATLTNVTESANVRVVGTPPGETETGEAFFDIIVAPTVIEEALPANLVDGINYSADATKATLVLTAPEKEFIQIAGSWNNYTPSNSDTMKRDPSTGKYWLEVTGLTSGQYETYQYWVFDTNPIADSPSLVKTADPYSPLVLSPFDDPFNPNLDPNLPAYPSGQEREVTVLQTGQTQYPWVVNNFNKPKKEDLIVYEVLIRDFDTDRNYQNLIDRIDYFKNLNINAIQLMPIMEFEGNETWGYNTSFHMALDKFYGTPEKFKEFVDVCHQNGIAVILDIALNHATGRNPLVRMWMDDPDDDGWGDPSSENPYFNTEAQHDYSVFNDFNHQSTLTQDYTKRVVTQWIEEYKIDGFRWDLTKGFTQNCGPGSAGGCTDSYQQDRVDVLQQYADDSWSVDDTHYVIFEHLGGDSEEQQWANYRIGEDRGIMMWGKMTSEYTDLVQGFGANINRMGHVSRGFTEPRLLGYPESHDEERVMYEAVEFGNNSNGTHNVRDLNTALSRMSAMGAVSVMIPGPKMIWHFGALGMDNSIFTCNNGTINNPDCKLDTKPQPQWSENWLGDANRKQIYDDWSRLHALKVTEDVFEGDYAITSGGLTTRVDVFDTSIPTTELRNVIVLANFDVVSQSVNTNFPGGVTSTWYDLMDPTGATTVPQTTSSITIPAGQFRIFGNQSVATLSDADFDIDIFTIFPNPVETSFKVNSNVNTLEVYDLMGKVVKSFDGNFTKNSEYDISELNTGVYIIRIENSDGQSHIDKLIKQ